MTVIARRQLFNQLLGIGNTQVAEQPPAPPDPLSHLLNRISFGARQEEVDQVLALRLESYLERQLDYQQLDDGALERALASNLPSLAMSNLELLRNYGPQTRNQFQPLGELRAATLLRQIHSPRQLYEVMVEFWSNHFSVQHTDGLVQQFKTSDDRAIRQHALGRFRDLLNANARSPAMLFFLDNYTNIASGPNENYARELLELHTLGVSGGYTEDDVKAVARAFTGWTFDRRTYEFAFNAAQHDRNEKIVLGQRLAAGRGIEDGQQVLDLLLAHPSTARFLATKLVRRFVADQPPAELVERVAATYVATDGDIRAMLRTLLLSAEFAASADLKARRPVEFVVAALRVTAATLTGETYFRVLNNTLEQLGQLCFMWPEPDGYPDTQDHWFNTSAWIARWNFAFALAENTLDRGIRIDALALAGSAKSATQLVDTLQWRLLRRPLASADRAALIAHAANGRSPEQALPANELAARARELVGLLLASRYFHYR